MSGARSDSATVYATSIAVTLREDGAIVVMAQILAMRRSVSRLGAVFVCRAATRVRAIATAVSAGFDC